MSAQSSPATPPPRRHGGQPANQNARTHGFYADSLTAGEKQHLTKAVDLKGLQPEIALLRVKLLGLLSSPTVSPELLLQATRTLTRMIDVNNRISHGS